MTRLVLAGSALVFFAFGLGFLAMPMRLLGTLGPLATTPDVITDLRAIYGGLNLGLGLGLAATLRRPELHRPALWLIALTLGAVAGGRALGMATTGFERGLTPIFLAMEATGAVLAVLALRRRPAPPR